MSIRNFIYPIRLAQALLIVALCGVLSAGALAGSYSSRGSNTKHSSRGHSSYRSRFSSSRSTSSYSSHPAQWKSSSQHSSYYHGTTAYKSTGGHASSWNAGTTNSHPSVWQSPGNHASTGFRPSVASHITNRASIYASVHDPGAFYRPVGYKPPVLRGGFYYYASRPGYRPCHFGFWAFDYDAQFCRPSVYFYFGYFPYVQIARIHVLPYVTVSYVSAPVIMDNGYYLSRNRTIGLSNALSDIRNAWVNGRFDLIKNHVNADQSIAVLLDGKYDYSVDANDYIQMTSDAVGQVHTISFTWEKTEQRSDGDYTAFGKHVYSDSSGDTKTVYVSYTLSKIDGVYSIVEVGSSTSSLI